MIRQLAPCVVCEGEGCEFCPATVLPQTAHRAVLLIRLTTEQLHSIQEYAWREGESVPSFVRGVLADRLDGFE